MKRKNFFQIVTITFVAIVVVACGRNGNSNGTDVVNNSSEAPEGSSVSKEAIYQDLVILGDVLMPGMEEQFELVPDVSKRFGYYTKSGELKDPSTKEAYPYQIVAKSSNDRGGVVYDSRFTIPEIYDRIGVLDYHPHYVRVGKYVMENGEVKTYPNGDKVVEWGLASVITGKEVIPCKYIEISGFVSKDDAKEPYLCASYGKLESGQYEKSKKTYYYGNKTDVFWANGIKIHEGLKTGENFVIDQKSFGTEVAKQGGKEGIKLNGRWVLPAKYDELHQIPGAPAYYVAYKDGKCGVIYYKGYVTVPFIYENHEFLGFGNTVIANRVNFKSPGVDIVLDANGMRRDNFRDPLEGLRGTKHFK